MGRLHAKAIVDSDLAALAAVVDVDPEARRLADAHGAQYHASIEALLDADDIDGFVVCLPDRAHVETACALLEAGHAVLLEKPMADTLEGALQIAEASRRGNARLLVAHILRFDPRYAQAAAAVAEGQLGDVVHLSSGRLGVRDIGRRLDGSSSVLFYLGVHDVDLIQWISGKRIVRVSSFAASKLMPSLGVDSEDVIVTNAELEDGVVAQLYAGWTLRSDTPSPINARTTVVGSDGALEVDVRDHGLRMHTSAGWAFPDGSALAPGARANPRRSRRAAAPLRRRRHPGGALPDGSGGCREHRGGQRRDPAGGPDATSRGGRAVVPSRLSRACGDVRSRRSRGM